jgi:hypothetical protein
MDAAPTFEALDAAAISPADERAACDLFARTYRDADLDYLRDALRRLRTIALARHAGELVGFALGESRQLDLPRLPAHTVRLAGLACVAPEVRRRGVMQALQERTFLAHPQGAAGLACGRMAHPATYRQMSRLPGTVPRLGVPPTRWQQEVACAIAEAYGVARFDPATFVCAGRGRPIGYPLMDIEASPDDWTLFERIDRDRGESLLGLCWLREPPPGWEDRP